MGPSVSHFFGALKVHVASKRFPAASALKKAITSCL